MSQNATLSPKQRRAVLAILAEPSIRAAAVVAGVHEKTLFRWLREPLFAAELQHEQTAQLGAISRRLALLAERALARLEATLQDEAAPAPVRLRAAELVLDRLLAFHERITLEERLAAIEARLALEPT